MIEEIRRMPRILVMDDEQDIIESLSAILTDEGFSITTCNTDSDFEEKMKDPCDVLLVDIWMNDDPENGIKILEKMQEKWPYIPCIMMSGHATIEKAIRTLKMGAYDFLEKPFSISKLLNSIKRAVEARNLREESLILKEDAYNLPLVTHSPIMKKIAKRVNSLKNANSIMFKGPIGAGKKHIAYHFAKKWGMKCYFIDCSGKDLLSIFQMTYRLSKAPENKAFVLDHPEDLCKEAQDELLKLIRLTTGNSSTHWISIVRDDSSNMRPDLKERLEIFKIEMPSLEERVQDMSELCTIFISYLQKITKIKAKEISLEEIKIKNWPGNIKQLKLHIEQSLYSDDSCKEEYDEDNLLLDPEFINQPLKESRVLFEKAYLNKLLYKTNGCLKEVAQKSGIDRTTLYRKLKQKK